MLVYCPFEGSYGGNNNPALLCCKIINPTVNLFQTSMSDINTFLLQIWVGCSKIRTRSSTPPPSSHLTNADRNSSVKVFSLLRQNANACSLNLTKGGQYLICSTILAHFGLLRDTSKTKTPVVNDMSHSAHKRRAATRRSERRKKRQSFNFV